MFLAPWSRSRSRSRLKKNQEPEPVGEKNQEPEPLEKKSEEPEPKKNLPAPQPWAGGIRMHCSKFSFNLFKVNSTLREADIELGEQDWDERKNINKRKKIILDGKDPDQVQKEKEQWLKEKRKLAKKERKKMIKMSQKQTSS